MSLFKPVFGENLFGFLCFLVVLFHGDFFTISMSLQQYYINSLLAVSLMPGCAVSSLLRGPLQRQHCKLVQCIRGSHVLHGRKCEKRRHLHEHRSNPVWRAYVAADWMSQDCRNNHLQPHTHTHKDVKWTASNVSQATAVSMYYRWYCQRFFVFFSPRLKTVTDCNAHG